jgi:methyl-accepting chemotaxis protein
MAMNKMPMVMEAITRKGREILAPQKVFRFCKNVALSLYFRKLNEVPEKIVTVTAGLKAASDGVEEKFLEMGQRLQTIYAGTSGLTRQIQETTRALAGTGEENILGKVEGLAEKSQKALAGHQERVATSLAPVKAGIEYLEALCQSCDQIDRIAMNLRVVGLNIGVESTRSIEARDMFTIVADEIVQLSNKVNAAGSLIRGDAETARADEVRAVDSISKGLQELQSLSAEAAKAVNAAVSEIKGCIHSATAVFDQSCERSDEISRQIGEIVTGIQFHDSMRQRVEHIVDALVEVAQKMSDSSSVKMAAAGSIRARLGEAHGVGSLQMMQLVDVIKEINRVHGQSAGAFERIGNEMRSLSESMKAAWRDPSAEAFGGKPGDRDAFESLIEALALLKALMDRADLLVEEIEKSVLRSSEIGARFSRHMKTVESIGFETHIKALNAIVRAAHLGEKGQTLEVLAQEMSRLSRETRGFVANVVDNLGQMSNCADKLRQDTDHPQSVSQNRGEAAETLGRGIEAVAENKNQLMEQLDAAARRAEALCEEIATAVMGLSFLPSLADGMTGCLEDLKESLHALKPFGKKTQTDPDQLIAAYTMQRERDIHQQLFVRDTPTGVDAELFSGGEVTGAIGNDRDATEGCVELFGDSDEEKKEENAQDFGENVELF